MLALSACKIQESWSQRDFHLHFKGRLGRLDNGSLRGNAWNCRNEVQWTLHIPCSFDFLESLPPAEDAEKSTEKEWERQRKRETESERDHVDYSHLGHRVGFPKSFVNHHCVPWMPDMKLQYLTFVLSGFWSRFIYILFYSCFSILEWDCLLHAVVAWKYVTQFFYFKEKWNKTKQSTTK